MGAESSGVEPNLESAGTRSQSGTVIFSHEYVTDVSDRRRLVGLVDNVFVGRVIAQGSPLSRTGSDWDVWTPFTVEVKTTIKGAEMQMVAVLQEGGFSEDGSMWTSTADEEMLEVGRSYMFATQFSVDDGWHTLVPSYGAVLISSEESEGDLIESFENALRNQIPYDPLESLNVP